MLAENEIPEQVRDWLADLEALMELEGYSRADQVRFVGLFLYRRVFENARSIPHKRLNQMLGAIQKAHQSGRNSSGGFN